MIELSTPIEKLARVGPKGLPRLKKLGIKTVKDLLWHFPARYDDFSTILPIAQVEAGAVVNIKGRIVDISTASLWRRRKTVTNATVEDESGIIHAAWFNQPYIEKSLPEGTMVSLAGKVAMDKKGFYLSNPAYERIYGRELTHTGRLVPIYPETEGVTSKYLRFLIKPLLASARFLPDPLPQEILKKYSFLPLGEALCSIHFPETLERAEAARDRFTFEELLLFQLRLLRDRRRLRTLQAPRIDFDKELIAGFVRKLPFELTNDQRVAAYEILQDLTRSYPMNRLLNGDVGSGKTVVALIAAFETAVAGYQAVFMAPTEILAKQHYNTITSLLDSQFPIPNFQIKIGLLTGSEARQRPISELTNEKINKKLMQRKIASGEINIIIGTHAVIQKGVEFARLGLVVIDEQHRFGVEQRMKLVKSQPATSYQLQATSSIPHLLSMTATPIPRTLALTIYGDLEISLLKEKPKGRQPIITKIIPHEKRKAAYKFIEEQVKSGRQVFVICPRIEISKVSREKDALRQDFDGELSRIVQPKLISQAKLIWAEVKAVTEEYEKLSKEIFPNLRVAMLHGRMKAAEKDKTMNDFRSGRYDILVSTSVVEVGVDISNATVMMIESAERFGLAQLHQFRGRIGRGGQQSFCLLFASSSDIPANRRLQVLERTDNGFELAEMDLKLRGPGEFAGIKQSGVPDFAMASLADVELIKKARLEAKLLLKEDPSLNYHPTLLTRLSEMQRLVHFE